MYKILVVDDESRHRKGIVEMIRSMNPDYSLYEAGDGMAAMQMIHTHNIDIMITDIQMPNMDGLQLIGSLNQYAKDVKVVILTAYGYFDYAKKALKLGAFDYLLKPVEQREIAEIMQKLEISIKRKRKLDFALPVYTNYLLNKWLKGETSPAELEEIHNLLPSGASGVLLLSETSGAFADEEAAHLKDWIQQHLASSLSFPLTERKNTIATIWWMDENPHAAHGLPLLEDVLTRIEKHARIEWASGASGVCSNLSLQVHDAFQQAEKALEYQFYTKESTWVFYPDLSGQMTDTIAESSKEEALLHESILKMDLEKSRLVIGELMEHLTADKYPPPERLKEHLKHILVDQIKKINEHLSDEKCNELKEDIGIMMENARHLEDLKRKIDEFAENTIQFLNYRKNSKNILIIEKCREYIDSHYMEDISLEKLARLFYFSPSYFSSFFKNYTGTNVSDFILQVRLQKAKQLLIQTDTRVYDIAAQIGYRDAGYFIRLFKRELGATPEEFRKNHGIHRLEEYH